MEEKKKNLSALDLILGAAALAALMALVLTLIMTGRAPQSESCATGAEIQNEESGKTPRRGITDFDKKSRIIAPSDDPRFEPGTASISGTVFFDSDNVKTPALGMEVRLSTLNPAGVPVGALDAVRTGKDGAYKFDFLLNQAAPYAVTARDPMYKTAYFESNKGLMIKPGDRFEGINLFLASSSTITLYIFDISDNAPVSGTPVEVAFKFDSFAVGETDGAGEYRFSAPGPGVFKIKISAKGYAPLEWNRNFSVAGEVVGIGISRSGALAGKVTGPDGKPVSNAVLRFHCLGDQEFTRTSDADGNYIFEALAPCSGELFAVSDKFGTAGFTGVEITEGATAYKDVVFENGVEISGMLADAETGAPIRGAVLTLNSEYYHTLLNKTARTGQEGEFRFAGPVGSGNYYIYAVADGYMPEVFEHVNVDTKQENRELKLTMKRGASIRGRLVTSSGAPIAGEAVTAIDRFGRRIGTLSAGDGRFEVAGLLDNETYNIEITPKKLSYKRLEKISADSDLGEITIEQFGTVTGSVEWDGVPVRGATVSLWTAEDPFTKHAVDTDDAGAFSFSSGKPGNYFMEISVPGYVPFKSENILIKENSVNSLGTINLEKK